MFGASAALAPAGRPAAKEPANTAQDVHRDRLALTHTPKAYRGQAGGCPFEDLGASWPAALEEQALWTRSA